MNVKITGKQFELTESIKNYVFNAFKDFEKYNVEIISASCVISADEKQGKKGFVVDFIINMARKDTFIISRKDKDLYAVIDILTEKACKILRREHDKENTHKNKDLGKEIRQSFGGQFPENEEMDEIVPTELELYKPLEIEEALNKLKQSSDQFLVFNDIDAKMRVLYKRKDGKFGLF